LLAHPTLDLLHKGWPARHGQRLKSARANICDPTLEHAQWLALLLEHEVTLSRIICPTPTEAPLTRRAFSRRLIFDCKHHSRFKLNGCNDGIELKL